jgi:hypothetical protein
MDALTIVAMALIKEPTASASFLAKKSWPIQDEKEMQAAKQRVLRAMKILRGNPELVGDIAGDLELAFEWRDRANKLCVQQKKPKAEKKCHKSPRKKLIRVNKKMDIDHMEVDANKHGRKIKCKKPRPVNSLEKTIQRVRRVDSLLGKRTSYHEAFVQLISMDRNCW